MKKFLTVLIAMILMNSSVAFADTEIYEGVGEYLMTEETLDFAKNQAELMAQRDILEKVCLYVRSQSTMIDNELDEDEIVTVCAGKLQVIDTKYFMESEVEGIIVKAFVTTKIDIDELKILLEKAVKERVPEK